MAATNTTGPSPNRKDETGNVYGKLTVVRYSSSDECGQAIWFCRCDCGGVRDAHGSRLRKGYIVACCHACALTTHGHTVNGRKTAEFQCWKNMIERCCKSSRKDFADYGGRGIEVCPSWRDSFENFMSDMGMKPSPRHSLDRIDNDGNYEPSNCRWATASEQINNRRGMKFYSLGRESGNASYWARKIGISPTSMAKRLRKWPLEQALSLPKA